MKILWRVRQQLVGADHASRQRSGVSPEPRDKAAGVEARADDRAATPDRGPEHPLHYTVEQHRGQCMPVPRAVSALRVSDAAPGR
jgi:hypothetical protein